MQLQLIDCRVEFAVFAAGIFNAAITHLLASCGGAAGWTGEVEQLPAAAAHVLAGLLTLLLVLSFLTQCCWIIAV